MKRREAKKMFLLLFQMKECDTKLCAPPLEREKFERIEKLIAKALCPFEGVRAGRAYSLRIKDETESRTKEEKYSLSKSERV